MVPTLILVLTMFTLTNTLNLDHSLPPLPPCGSYKDCSTGLGGSYNFFTDISLISSCSTLCLHDPQCNYYSYNYSMNSPHYRHCYLVTDCNSNRTAQEDHQDTRQWVSAPKVCEDNISNPLLVALRSSYFRAS